MTTNGGVRPDNHHIEMTMRLHVLLLIAIVCIADCARALTIAEAKALPVGTNIEIGPVVVSTTNDLANSGYGLCVQDGSGGIMLFWSNAQMPALRSFIQTNAIVPGSSITVRGTCTNYSSLAELINVTMVATNGFAGVPAPILMDISDMQTGSPSAETNESMLVAIEHVTFQNAGGIFSSGVSYTFYQNGTSGVVRLQDVTDPLRGKPIPVGPCNIEGILSQYNADYQLLPLVITQDNLNIAVVTNVGFGLVYGTAPRTLAWTIANIGATSNLVVTAIEPVSGDTNKFVIGGGSMPLSVPAQSSVALDVTYAGGGAGDRHAALFRLLCNDPGDPTNVITFWGGVSSNSLADVWINEVDYDTPGSTAAEADEFVELCGPESLSITGWKLELWYSPSIGVYSNYATHTIGSFTFPNDTNHYGFYVLATSNATPGSTYWDEKATSLDQLRNNAFSAIRLLDATGRQVHFIECGASYALQYPYPWPDDIIAKWDSGSPERSLSLVMNGFVRTNMQWDVMRYMPGAPNVAAPQARLVEDTYVQLAVAANYEGGMGSFLVEPDSMGTFAARTWLKFDTAAAKDGFDAQFGTGAWKLVSATLELTEFPSSWSTAGVINVDFMPDTAWWEGPTNPPGYGVATSNMLCWISEKIYTNGATAAGSFSNTQSSAIIRCALTALPAIESRAATGGMVALRLYTTGGAAASFSSMNYADDPSAKPVLYLTAVIPEPAVAGLVAVAGCWWVCCRRRCGISGM